MCWLAHLTLDDCDALLAVASRTAGLLSASEARAVLTFAAEGRQRGYPIAVLHTVFRNPRDVAQIIGRPCGVTALGPALDDARLAAASEERGG